MSRILMNLKKLARQNHTLCVCREQGSTHKTGEYELDHQWSFTYTKQNICTLC